METDNKVQFAITAKTLGHPSKLYTPLTVINLEAARVARVNAMWDTGAEMCVMSEELAIKLKLDFQKKIRTAGLTGQSVSTAGLAYVSLISAGGIIPVSVAVVPGDIGLGKYSFIIGLNLIRLGTLCVSHSSLHTVLSFRVPARFDIDFVAEAFKEIPGKYIELSRGEEEILCFKGKEALRIIADAYGDPDLQNYLD